jgi:arylsulfatase A-like enzyme
VRTLLVAALAMMAAAFLFWPPAGRPLPDTIAAEDTVAHLSDALAADTVRAQNAADPVRDGLLEPGDRLRDGGGHRPSLIAPPPARIGFRLDVPPDAALRFDVGVERVAGDEPRSGVRFSLAVNGRETWSRTVNPAETRHERRWFDERVPLPAGTGVDVVLATDAADPSRPLAGTPGWGHVRLVRTTTQPRQAARAGAPNVVVLLVDTLRADRLGVGGALPSPTPTLDALAKGGLVFETMVAQSSWTLPSVATLFSGLHPRSHGALGSAAGDHGARWGFLSDRVTTWAEAASRAGITTYGVSTNALVSRGTNLAQGFESFTQLDWSPERKNWASATEVNALFLAWARDNRAHRFVAYLHYMEPHDPYTPPDDLRPPVPPGIRPAIAAGWVSDLAKKIARGQAPPLPDAELSYLRKLYTAEIKGWDRSLAELLDGLDDLGLRDDTILVVTSDHGEEFQEHGRLTHATQLYEELLRVPFVMVGPGVPKGRVAEVVQGIDVYPTLATLLGLPIAETLPGRNLLAEPYERRDVLSETASAIAPDGSLTDLTAYRALGWKLIDAPRVPRRELYDLNTDPRETTNQPDAPEGPLLLQRFESLAATTPKPPRVDGADPALDEKLRTLGYIE